MTDTITLAGLVATVPRHIVTAEGLTITSFRLASTHRRFDRSRDKWVDGETNWFTVTTFRQLAINVAHSIQKGDRIVTTGRLRIREWTAGEKAGTNIEVDAEAIGHDLSWGTSVFSRSIATAVAEVASTENAPVQGELTAQSARTDEGDANGSVVAGWATSALGVEPDADRNPLVVTETVATPF
jgi:single-strand DNA-binding protein